MAEVWVWADGTIFDPALPGYRPATAEEVEANYREQLWPPEAVTCPHCGAEKGKRAP